MDHILNGVVFDASGRKTATVEILLRALMDAGDQTIQQDNLHCSLGAVYLKRMNPMATNPVPVREPLIAELAEMASGGTNSISGSCETDHCTLHLSHRNSEDVSATDYAFAMVDGKVDVGSLTCVSTP